MHYNEMQRLCQTFTEQTQVGQSRIHWGDGEILRMGDPLGKGHVVSLSDGEREAASRDSFSSEGQYTVG